MGKIQSYPTNVGQVCNLSLMGKMQSYPTNVGQVFNLSFMGKMQSYPTKCRISFQLVPYGQDAILPYKGNNEAGPITWIVGQDFNAIIRDGNGI